MCKTNNLSPYGRWPFWVALIVALFIWAAEKGYAPAQAGLCIVGVGLFGVVLLAEDHRRAVANRIREAMRLSGLAFGEAASYMYGDPLRAPELTKALNGERALDIWRLELLPDEFHRHYALLELRDRGLPTLINVALKILPAVQDARRPA